MSFRPMLQIYHQGRISHVSHLTNESTEASLYHQPSVKLHGEMRLYNALTLAP